MTEYDDHQLTLDADEPGYYSYWASGPGCGSGAVGWFASAAEARIYAAESFQRGYAKWPVDMKPRLQRVDVKLLIAGPDRGAWGELSQEDRNTFTADHPWITKDGAA